MKDNCPYCKKNYCVAEVAFRNVECYGSNSFTVPCLYCGKIIDIYITRTTHLERVTKSYKKRADCDW